MMNALPLLSSEKSLNMATVVQVATCPLRICEPGQVRTPWRWPGQHGGNRAMQPIRVNDQFKNLMAVARQITGSAGAEAILVLL
ncbi:MAG: hypothetical protein ABFC54_01150, partial [Thermoguttaceae bacterium]